MISKAPTEIRGRRVDQVIIDLMRVREHPKAHADKTPGLVEQLQRIAAGEEFSFAEKRHLEDTRLMAREALKKLGIEH